MTGKRYMAQVARLSCLLYRLRGIDGTPAEVHHARKHGGLRSNTHRTPYRRARTTTVPDRIRCTAPARWSSATTA